MKGKEQRRAMVLTAVIEGRLTAAEAAELMSLSQRQERRLRHAFLRDGPAALVHGNRGRRPVHTLEPGLRSRVIALADGVYAGCNDQHLTELLAEREAIALSRSSVRRIRRAAGLRSPQRRRAPRHRSRRERMPQSGMLLQVDGSRHQWLGPDGPWLTLVSAIDDATGDVPYALFREQEDAQGYLLLLREVVRRRGVPLAIYSDRHMIFQSEAKKQLTLEEELAGKPPPTQVRRVLDELDIAWIGARSPQAKGRVERLWRIFQDRLYQELRLNGITSVEQANAALPALLARHNACFRQRAATPGSAYRRLAPSQRPADVFCFRYWRTVSKDNVVSLACPSRLALDAAPTPAPESKFVSTSTVAPQCTTRASASPASARSPVTFAPKHAARSAKSPHLNSSCRYSNLVALALRSHQRITPGDSTVSLHQHQPSGHFHRPVSGQNHRPATVKSREV